MLFAAALNTFTQTTVRKKTSYQVSNLQFYVAVKSLSHITDALVLLRACLKLLEGKSGMGVCVISENSFYMEEVLPHQK